jgi:hypothetical protein
MHLLALQMQKKSEDNPTWEEAMNGPDQAGYWEAVTKALLTLESKMSWDIVDRQPFMNVLPSTWAFRCKRYPNGTVQN